MQYEAQNEVPIFRFKRRISLDMSNLLTYSIILVSTTTSNIFFLERKTKIYYFCPSITITKKSCPVSTLGAYY